VGGLGCSTLYTKLGLPFFMMCICWMLREDHVAVMLSAPSPSGGVGLWNTGCFPSESSRGVCMCTG